MIQRNENDLIITRKNFLKYSLLSFISIPLMTTDKAYAYLTKNDSKNNEIENNFPTYAAKYGDILVFSKGTPSLNYEGKTLEQTYSNFCDKNYSINGTPWNSIANQIKKIVFEEIIYTNNVNYWFSNFSILEEIKNMEKLKGYITAAGMFYNSGNQNIEINLNNLDTRNVNSFYAMFKLTKWKRIHIELLNTSNGKDFHEFLMRSQIQGEYDFSNFDMRKATRISSFFYEAKQITKLIVNWDIPNVQQAGYIFFRIQKCAYLECYWNNTQNMTNMAATFFENYVLRTVKGLETLNTSNVTNMDDCFANSSNFTVNLSKWNVQKVGYARNFALNKASTFIKPSFKPGTVMYW